MKTMLGLAAAALLLCGCQTKSDQGGAESESSEVQTNSRGVSGMVQTNTQPSGAAELPHTTSPGTQ